MKALIVNGSPQKKGSTSGFLGKVIGCLLLNWKVWYASIRTQKEFPEIFQHFQEVDVFLFRSLVLREH